MAKVADKFELIRSKETKQVILPANSKLKEIADWILKMDAADERPVRVYHELDCYPLDGAVQFFDALQEVYGFVDKVDTPSFWGSNPPTMIGVPVGPGVTRQVPWGRFMVPGVEGWLATGLNANPTPKFVIQGEVKQRHMPEIEGIVALTEGKTQTRSIYKGKAVELDLTWLRNGDDFSPMGHSPRFTIPLEGITEDDLILPAKTDRQIRRRLFTPIEHSRFSERMGVPFKRGVLLAGDYGTGKTLAAWICAKKAVEAGITFIYLKSILDLPMCLLGPARQYSPTVVFAEDLDVAIRDPQSQEAERLRNALDGVNTKNDLVLTVATTNHLDVVRDKGQALLRPGRFDVVVPMERPDAEAAVRLVKKYGRGLLSPDTDFAAVGLALAGHLPAEIREAVESSKLACIERMCREAGEQGRDIDEAAASVRGLINHEDVLEIVADMHDQHEALRPLAKDGRCITEKLADALGSRLGNALGNSLDGKTAKLVAALAQEMGVNGQALLSSVRNGANGQ